MKKPTPPSPSRSPDASKAHHRPRGFQNRYLPFRGKRLRELLRWRYEAWLHGHPRAPTGPIAQVAPDLAFIHRNAVAGAAMQPAVTWIGHITALLQIGGLNILTDPVFSQRASPLQWAGPRRHTPPGLSLAQLPRVDVVLISHNHYDHLDEPSVRRLAKQVGGCPLFIVPLGLQRWLASRGIRHAVELDWWDELPLPSVAGCAPARLTLVPAQHWSARSLNDAMRTLWGGFAVLAADCHLLFAGDTGYSPDFIDIRQHFADRQTPERGGGFDLALLPIGAYEPRWFMQDQHVNPAEAVQIHLDLGAKRSLGVHWGCFQLTDEPLDQPPRDLAQARVARGLAEEAFFTLAVGQTWLIPPRPQPAQAARPSAAHAVDTECPPPIR